MKKTILLFLFLLFGGTTFAQHLYEHDYPVITEENPQIRMLLDAVSSDSIRASIEHLSSYWNRRYDSRYIWDVQDWLVAYYEHLGIDTVMLHDFPVPDSGIETADNILAIQWGTKTPNEFVICGAHYDSWNSDGTDPDTIRAPGADDNASGVAGILETARLLSRYTFDRSIIYANWCAEEIGLVGSAAYAKNMAEQGMDIVGYFNMDMNGYLEEGDEMHVHVVYRNRDSLIGNYFFNFCDIYYPELPVKRNWMLWGDSDFSSFNRNGYAAIHPFEDVTHSSPFIHSRQDILGLSVNNLEQSRQFAQLNLGAVATLAGINGTSIPETELVDVAVYPNPAKDRVTIVAEEGLRSVKICNLLGLVVEAVELNSENKLTLDLTNYATGVYVVQTFTKKGVVTQKLALTR